MPNTYLAPAEQGSRSTKEGVILIGDAWNMRHPLTGGGMTVALHDVLLLSKALVRTDGWEDWNAVEKILHKWHWDRKPLAATVNVLSVALYDLFGANGQPISWLHSSFSADV
jgi:squalene monooxygenase